MRAETSGVSKNARTSLSLSVCVREREAGREPTRQRRLVTVWAACWLLLVVVVFEQTLASHEDTEGKGGVGWTAQPGHSEIIIRCMCDQL